MRWFAKFRMLVTRRSFYVFLGSFCDGGVCVGVFFRVSFFCFVFVRVIF